MSGQKWLRVALLAALLAVTLAGCTLKKEEPGMANPASVYCDEQGGTLEIRSDASGGQYGVCMFDDGTECEEWAYFNGECAPGDMEEAPAP